MSITLIPAFGRDYKTAGLAEADFHAGRDFIVADMSNRWGGKPVNKEALLQNGISSATIRYNRKTRVVLVLVERTAK